MAHPQHFDDAEAAVASPSPSDASRWWICHLGVVLAFPATVLFFLPRTPPLLGAFRDVVLWVYFLAVLVSVFGSLYGYHAEARALAAAGSNWVPGKWWWTAGHILLSPFLTAPLYLIDRWLHIGLPWSQLKFW